jgi:hypothetical protein
LRKLIRGLLQALQLLLLTLQGRSRRKGKINLPFLVQVLTPVISLFFILGFAILPFFLHIEAKRLRIEIYLPFLRL